MHIQVSDIRTCGDRCRVGIARIYPDTVPKVGVFLIDLDNCSGADRINWIARSIYLIGALVIRIPIYSIVWNGWIVATIPCFFVLGCVSKVINKMPFFVVIEIGVPRIS